MLNKHYTMIQKMIYNIKNLLKGEIKMSIMNRFKRVIAFSLVAVTGFGVAGSANQILASTIPLEISSQVENSTGRKNVNIIKLDNNSAIYTYEENGKSYKVIESITDNFDYVSSKIYVLNNSGDYILDSTIITEVKNGIITVSTTKNGNTVVEKSNLTSSFTSNMSRKESNIQEYSLEYPYEDLTSWEFSGTFKGSDRIKKYTLLAVTAVIANIVNGLGGGILSSSAVTAVSTVAGAIISDDIPVIYYTQDVYYKYIKDMPTKLPRAEKTITVFYSDKDRTDKIEKVTNEYYASGYEPR